MSGEDNGIKLLVAIKKYEFASCKYQNRLSPPAQPESL